MSSDKEIAKSDSSEELTCSICLLEITDKSISGGSNQLECGHYYHRVCIRLWCIECVQARKKQLCPYCKEEISNEYLDILDIRFSGQDASAHRARVDALYNYIIQNKIHQDMRLNI